MCSERFTGFNDDIQEDDGSSVSVMSADEADSVSLMVPTSRSHHHAAAAAAASSSSSSASSVRLALAQSTAMSIGSGDRVLTTPAAADSVRGGREFFGIVNAEVSAAATSQYTGTKSTMMKAMTSGDIPGSSGGSSGIMMMMGDDNHSLLSMMPSITSGGGGGGGGASVTSSSSSISGGGSGSGSSTGKILGMSGGRRVRIRQISPSPILKATLRGASHVNAAAAAGAAGVGRAGSGTSATISLPSLSSYGLMTSAASSSAPQTDSNGGGGGGAAVMMPMSRPIATANVTFSSSGAAVIAPAAHHQQYQYQHHHGPHPVRRESPMLRLGSPSR